MGEQKKNKSKELNVYVLCRKAFIKLVHEIQTV